KVARQMATAARLCRKAGRRVNPLAWRVHAALASAGFPSSRHCAARRRGKSAILPPPQAVCATARRHTETRPTMTPTDPKPSQRRKVIQAAAGASLLQLATPFIIPARAADTVKLGLDNPLTGTYAAVGKNEMIGCELAVEQINAKGGILGRQVQLLSEDSTSGDAGTCVQKARKLIDRDGVKFLLGNVNSALSLAMADVAYEKGVLHVVTGGHTDAVTGKTCHYNVFRICNTT